MRNVQYSKYVIPFTSKCWSGIWMRGLLIHVGRYSCFAIIIIFVIVTLFLNTLIPIKMSKLVESMHSTDKTRKCATEKKIDTTILPHDSVKNKCHVYISTNKGNEKKYLLVWCWNTRNNKIIDCCWLHRWINSRYHGYNVPLTKTRISVRYRYPYPQVTHR